MHRTSTPRPVLAFCVALITAVLTACGGSGEPSGNASPAPPSTATTTVTSTSTTTSTTSTTRPSTTTTTSKPPAIPSGSTNFAYSLYKGAYCEVQNTGTKWTWYKNPRTSKVYCYKQTAPDSIVYDVTNKDALYNTEKYSTPLKFDFRRSFDVNGDSNPVFDTLLVQLYGDGNAAWFLPLTDASDPYVFYRGSKHHPDSYVNESGAPNAKAEQKAIDGFREHIIVRGMDQYLPADCATAPVGCVPNPA